MARIEWDALGEHIYETGVNQGVLYPVDEDGAYSSGVAWNGLTAVNESPSGAESNPLWADNIKYLNLVSAEEFGATIEAYTYPPQFEACDGSATIVTGAVIGQQSRQNFGLSYKTIVGNDTQGESYGYKLHIIYACTASPSERSYQTINDSPEAISFSWEVKTTPVPVTGYKATANLVVDSTKVSALKMAKLEAVLYGVDADEFDASKTYNVGDIVTHSEKTYICKAKIEEPGEWDDSDWEEIASPGPRLPLPDEVITLLS